MKAIRTVQQRFTAGELDPLLLGRSNLEYYYNAAETMTNVIVIPQGGFKTRPGLEYIARLQPTVTREAAPTITAPNGGTGGNANDLDAATVLLTTTNLSTTDDYVVASYDLGSAKTVSFVDIVGLTLTAGVNDEFDIEGSLNGSAWTVIGAVPEISTTAISFRYRINASYRYIRLIRNGTTDETTAKVQIQEFNVFTTTGTLSNARLVPFNQSNLNRYVLLFTDQNIAIYKNGVFQTDVRALEFTSARLARINWTQSADTGIFVHESIYPHRLLRNSDTDWDFDPITFEFIPKYDFVATITNPAQTLTPSAVDGTVTLTAGGGTIFSAASVNQYVNGNGGRARIVAYTSATVVTAVVEIPFFNITAMASGSWEYETGWEDAWSVTRGFPRAVTFHQSRLWFGGSTALPQNLWGSRVGLFFDFDPGALGDSDSIDVQIQDDDVNVVINLYSQRTLQIFTTSSEYAVLTSLNEPITPKNINVTRQTQKGSSEGLRVYENEGQTVYVQRGGKTILGYIFNDVENAYTNDEISLLSSHLVISPVDMTIRKSTDTDETNLLLLVNGDGTLTAATLLVKQNVVGFARQTTEGSFLNTCVDDVTPYFVVERELDGETHRYLERFNSDMVTDAGYLTISGLPQDTFSTPSHLDGVECKVRADGSIMANQTPIAGSVTIERDAEDYFEIGLDFIPYVKTLPVEFPELGPMLGRKVRISEVALRLYETVGIRVSSNGVVFRGFGLAGAGSPLDAPPPSFTGDKIVSGIKGWSYRGQIEITQDTALPMTILSMSYVVGF